MHYDVAAIGELLIDFTYAGKSASGMRLFEQNPGGAPANFLAACAKRGLRTALIGKVGKDMHGDFLIETLKEAGIGTEGILRDKDVFTTLAFVDIADNGERSFSFARKPGADTMIRKEEVKREILENTAVFHFGSLSLTDEPSKSAAVGAVKAAKAAGALISYDPNYREALWESPEAAAKAIRETLPLADMVKVSEEEALLITGTADPEKAAERIMQEGPVLTAVTLGEKGAAVCANGHSVFLPALRSEAADTTGAGDAFWGGFVSEFLRSGTGITDLGEEDLRRFALIGTVTAGLCVRKRGGIPSMPSEEEIREILKKL